MKISNIIATTVNILRWTANVIIMIAIGMYAFIVTMPCASCGNWDLFVVPVTLIAIPLLSMLIAIKWPIIAGEALISVGILMGWYLHTNSIWVIFLYAFPSFIAGIFFLIAGIYSFITGSDSRYKPREPQENKSDLELNTPEENVA
jgi:hypothetical protein